MGWNTSQVFDVDDEKVVLEWVGYVVSCSKSGWDRFIEKHVAEISWNSVINVFVVTF